MNNLKGLQSGTDVRGIVIKNEEMNSNFTDKEARELIKGFLLWLKEKNDGDISIAIGCDSRLSGEGLKNSCIKELSKYGITIYDCGLATTPAMFMTTIMKKYACTGAVMITASHLPFYYNGMKFFTHKGGCEKEEISRIIELANSPIEINKTGKIKKANLIDDYSKLLVNKIKEGTSRIKKKKPLEGLKIIVDAGNGAGGFFANKVLNELGADTKGSQFLESDGTFPNHIPNPEDASAMESISKAVLSSKADLGIIFDADVDRAAIVSKDGFPINKNALIAMISAIVLEEHPGSTIVTDSITSDGLKKFIEELGGKHHRFKRGYKNVINEAIRLNNLGEESHLAIETSGHAAIKENYFLDDGAYLIAKLLIKMANMNNEGKDFISLIKNLEYPKESKVFRLPINTSNFKKYGEDLLKDLEKLAVEKEGWSLAKNNFEGIKVCFHEGWFLIRLSLHEPLLAINIESNKENGCEEVIKDLERFLKNYNKVDLSKIK